MNKPLESSNDPARLDHRQQQSSTTNHPKRYLKTITLISSFGGLLFGYDTGVINGALPYMARPDQLNLSAFLEGLVASSLILGAAFGAVFTGKLADSKGRKRVIMYLAFVFLVTTIGCSFAQNAQVMIFFRFLLGLAVGGASVTVPAFLAEVSPVELRGRMVTQNELMIVTGQLLAYTFNAVLANYSGGVSHIWRFMLVLATLPAIVLWIGMFFVPESPRWYASKGKFKSAWRVLMKIRHPKRAKLELTSIKKAVHTEQKLSKASFKDLAIPWIRRIVFLGIGLSVIQQVTGVNSIMYYGTQILKDSGFSTNVALIANVANGIISVLAVFLGIWLLDKVNHRPMLMIGFAGTSFALLMISIFSMTLNGTALLPYLVLSMTVMFLAFQQSTISPVTWLMLSEIFPQRLRGLGMGVSVFCLWITNFMISLLFPVIQEFIGLSATFFLFFLCGIAALLFVKLALPETRGKSLEALEIYFRNKGRKIAVGDQNSKLRL
ncbi:MULTISPECIES: sugar porter family MFS transporter [Sporolactobacillus]|jgi:major inositol transporter-like SP family MFS transporter|uniref:MFS transporter n=1 Tax=Sporolactobacillus terrae TaxID=269673 RepID=A0ABX5Q7C8_9BACL|nr:MULTISPECIES: sugar porter family MFS transporter [Sporolactobacillus]QAA22529.1 MFS transporter [Sporolactobacillus terrae]QAA25503.1 MFS transporter [Sporolactobacillus terrae]